MSVAEIEHFTKLVQQTRNVGDKRGRLQKKATRFLRGREIRQRQDELAKIKSFHDQPSWVTQDLLPSFVDRNAKRRVALEDDLADNVPPPVSGEVKDALVKLERQLREKWTEGMPTAEVMRRNPPGAADMHMKWERANKDRILAWKNVRRLLDPDNEDRDYTNIEVYRPAGITRDMAATFMMGAQIPGQFAMTPLAKANWPLGEPKVDTSLKQAERVEVADEMIAAGEAKPEERDQLLNTIKQLQAQLAAEREEKQRKAETKEKQRQRGLALAAHAKAKREEAKEQRKAEAEAPHA